MSKFRLLSIVTVIVVILMLATTAYGAVTVLSQTVAVSVQVNPEPNVPVYIYSDTGTTTVLSGLHFTYVQGQPSAPVTAYMKTVDVTALGLGNGDNIPVFIDSGLPGITITSVVGLASSGGVTPITITASGGSSAVGTYAGNATFNK